MKSTHPSIAVASACPALRLSAAGSAIGHAFLPACRPAARLPGPALALALMLAATAAGAQSGGASSAGVYRHVMPDGKVVYSDRPDEGTGQSSRLIAPQIRAATPATEAARPPSEPKTPEARAAKAAEELAERMRERKGTAKAAVRESTPAQLATAPATAPQAAPEPALVQALMGVLGKADLLQRFADTCSRTLPTSMGRYMDAAEGWQRRNGDTVGQAHRILSGGLRPEHAQLITGEIKRIGDREFAQVTAATMHQRIKWCDNGVDEIKAGKLDVFNNATLTRPLNTFGRT